MAYKDKNGVTAIREHSRNSLSISYETDLGDTDSNEKTPVILYCPDQKELDHEHIALEDSEAIALHKWLTEFLSEKGLLKSSKARGKKPSPKKSKKKKSSKKKVARRIGFFENI